MQSLRKTELAEFEFTEAEDGEAALVRFSPRNTDILFVDWNMPNLTGIDLVRKLRASEKSRRVPIVMVTSEKAMGKIQEALDEAGADEYLTKPFTVEELTRKLSRLLAAPSSGYHEEPPSPPAGSRLLGKLFGS